MISAQDPFALRNKLEKNFLTSLNVLYDAFKVKAAVMST
jgi:hypothetical protein